MSEATEPVGVFHTRVEWIDTDAAGIYHNSTITRFVEAAEARLITDRSLDGYFPSSPRVRYEVDFEAPLVFGQDVTTTVTVAHIGTASMRWEFEVWGEEIDGHPRRRAARGSYVVVHIGDAQKPRSERRATPWPDSWIAALTDRSGE